VHFLGLLKHACLEGHALRFGITGHMNLTTETMPLVYQAIMAYWLRTRATTDRGELPRSLRRLDLCPGRP